MLRPISSKWFELVVLRRDLGAAMDCVARTGIVELDSHSETIRLPEAKAARLDEASRRFSGIREIYAGYWDNPVLVPIPAGAPFEESYEEALAALEVWSKSAATTVQALRTVRAEIDMLMRLKDLFASGAARIPELGKFLKVGPHLRAAIMVFPSGTRTTDEAFDIPTEVIEGKHQTYVLALGPAARVSDFVDAEKAAGGEEFRLPDWVNADAVESLGEIEARLAGSRASCERLEAELEDIGRTHNLREVLGTILQIEWLIDSGRHVGHSERFARITGWVLGPQVERLQTDLAACGIHHVLAFPDAPADAAPPVVLFNPVWARRFEMLTRMIGMPGHGEADPTVIVALVAPLLFGFMFGDVGQGAVLLIAGLLLREKMPALGILIPGGAMAILFGFAFGSVFGREDLIPPFWLHPLHEPVHLLVLSIAGGAVILLSGLSIQALQMRWQGHLSEWMWRDAGLLLCYLGLLASLVMAPALLVVAAIGALWFVAGAASLSGKGAILSAIGKLVETILQLLVNTVSFARAGAFALAHAGLSVAIVGLADASGPVFYWIVLTLGNVFVLALEGLVVSIQTTRLLLFEFFIRFLSGGGREFRPLAPIRAENNFAKEAA